MRLHVPSKVARREIHLRRSVVVRFFAPRVFMTRFDKELVLNAQISGRTVDRHGTLPKGAPEVNGLWF